METKYTNISYLLIVFAISFTSCTNKNEKTETNTVSGQENTSSLTENKIDIPEEPKVGIFTDTFFAENFSDTEIKTQMVHKKVPSERKESNLVSKKVDDREDFVNHYDTLKYNGVIVNYFTAVSKQLHGKPYFAESSSQLLGAITEILTTKLKDETDIVLLIDKTASMDDDLFAVRNSLDSIYKLLSGFDNVKLAIASYGDKNYHQDFWYNRSDLSTDKEILVNYMDSYKTIGNPDTPESVNDAIVKTVREMNWTNGNRRMILVIGDAPSQEPPLSDYSIQDVVKICDSANIIFNLYPVILSLQGSLVYDTPAESFPLKIYPNPAKDFTTVEMKYEQTYYYDIIDITGKKVRSGNFYGANNKIYLDGINNGSYLIQVYNPANSIYSTAKLLIQN